MQIIIYLHISRHVAQAAHFKETPCCCKDNILTWQTVLSVVFFIDLTK